LFQDGTEERIHVNNNLDQNVDHLEDVTTTKINGEQSLNKTKHIVKKYFSTTQAFEWENDSDFECNATTISFASIMKSRVSTKQSTSSKYFSTTQETNAEWKNDSAFECNATTISFASINNDKINKSLQFCNENSRMSNNCKKQQNITTHQIG